MSKFLTLLTFVILAFPLNIVSATSQPQAFTAEEIMAMRPFAATDVTMFSRPFCGREDEEPPMRPAAPPEGVDLTDEATREAYYEAWVIDYMADEPPELQAKALAIYRGEMYDRVDYGVLISRFRDRDTLVKSSALRAGLIPLLGTIGEAAIEEYVTNDLIEWVEFEDFRPLGNAADPRGMMKSNDAGEMSIQVDDRYQYENPALFAHLLAHEIGHQDFRENEAEGFNELNSAYEEMALHAIDVFIHLQVIAEHPEIAQTGTRLARIKNTEAWLRLNSGEGVTLSLGTMDDDTSTVSIVPGCNVPGGIPTSFLSRWSEEGNQLWITPGNSVVDAFLSALAGRTITDMDFSPEMWDIIDEAGNGPMTYQELVRAAIALKLDVPPCSDCEVEEG